MKNPTDVYNVVYDDKVSFDRVLNSINIMAFKKDDIHICIEVCICYINGKRSRAENGQL